MREPERITRVYEDYIGALLKVLSEISFWRTEASPESKEALRILHKKRKRIQKRYLDGQ